MISRSTNRAGRPTAFGMLLQMGHSDRKSPSSEGRYWEGPQHQAPATASHAPASALSITHRVRMRIEPTSGTMYKIARGQPAIFRVIPAHQCLQAHPVCGRGN